MVVLHPEMGRLWVWAWACLLVVGFAREARAGDPRFPPVRVCVRPPEVPVTITVWAYSPGGQTLPLLMRAEFMKESDARALYIFDPNAPPANTKFLPIRHNKLPCAPKPPPPPPLPAEKKEVTEPLAPSPPAAPKAETKKEASKPPPQPFVSPNKEPASAPRPRLPKDGVTTNWPNTVLPVVCPDANRTTVLSKKTVLPMTGQNTAEDELDPVRSNDRSGRCGERVVAAPAPGMKKPEPPPPGGKDYAASKAIEQARQAARDAERVGAEVGGTFGKALGDAQEAFKTLHRLTAGALPRILQSNPKFVDELQSGLAQKLNAIPALPAYADPKLAEIARKGFERGFGAGLSDAKQKATAVYLAAEVALALSGEAAILTQRVGAAALKGALARLKGMPVFVPGAIDGGGAFFRLPKPPIAQAAKGGAAAPIRRVGDLLNTADDVLANPKLLEGMKPQDLMLHLGGKVPEGWRIEAMAHGRHAGEGFMLRQYTSTGTPTGRVIQWHPGGGHHGPTPYWKVNAGHGPVRVGPQF